MLNDHKTTRTVERVLTRDEIARALPAVDLTQEEELVIRLRYGIGLPPDARLTYVARGNEDLDARLALIEKAILDMLEEGHDGQPASVLAKLKGL